MSDRPILKTCWQYSQLCECMALCRVMEQGETWGRDLATLVGDAAHPTTPALGQGGCMALEVLHRPCHSSPGCCIRRLDII